MTAPVSAGPRIPAWITDPNVITSIQAGFVQLGCDDCPGRPDCRCADGRTDTTDCTCPPQGGDA